MPDAKNGNLDLIHEAQSILDALWEPVDRPRMPFSREEADKLLRGEAIVPPIEPKDPYFAYVFLVDDGKRLTPLWFSRPVFSGEFLMASKDLPVFNEVALEKLGAFGIDAGQLTPSFDPSSFLLALTSSLSLMTGGSLSLTTGFEGYSDEAVAMSRAYSLVMRLYSLSEKPLPYRGLFQDALKEEPEATMDFFRGPYDVLRRLHENRSFRLLVSDGKIRDGFLSKAILESLNRSRSVLLVTASENAESRLSLFLEREGFLPFVTELKDFQPEASLSLVLPSAVEKVSDEERRQDKSFRSARSQYFLLTQRREELESAIGLSPESVQKILSLSEKGAQETLNLPDYSLEDFEHDQAFLPLLSALSSVSEGPLDENPCYGLTLSGRKENYDQMVSLAREAMEGLTDFEGALSAQGLKNLDGSRIDRMSDFLLLGEELSLLDDYSGFSPSFFRLDHQVEALPLKALENAYQAYSSARLLLSHFVDEEVLSSSLSDWLSKLSRHGFSGHAAWREMKKHLLGRTKKKPFLSLLQTTSEAQERLRRLLPPYEEAYGPLVLSANGLLEIEAIIPYLERFRKMEGRVPSFSLKNEQVSSLLFDEEKRKAMKRTYQGTLPLFEKEKARLNRLVGMFLETREDFLSMPFETLRARLGKRQSATWVQFSQYALFRDSLPKTSTLFQVTVRKTAARGESLEGFSDRFYRTVYSRLGKNLEEEERKFASSEKEDLVRYLFGLYRLSSAQAKRRQAQISFRLSDEFRRGNGLEEYGLLRKRITEKNYDYPDRTKELRLLLRTHPILLARKEDLVLLPKGLMSLGIVFQSGALSNADLLNALQASQETLFVNILSSDDARIQGYPDAYLGSENLMKPLFLPGTLPPLLEEKLISFLGGKGYELREDPQGIFPYLIGKVGKAESEGVLLPTDRIPKGKRSLYLTTLRESLFLREGRVLYVLDLTDACLNPQSAFQAMFDPPQDAFREWVQERERRLTLTMTNDPGNPANRLLQEIKASFPLALTKEEQEALLRKGDYEELFLKLQPVRPSLVSSLSSPSFEAWIESEKEKGRILLQDGFEQYADVRNVTFRRSTPETRPIEEVSTLELMQGAKAFLIAIPVLYVEELKSILASLLGYGPEEPSFSVRFDDMLYYLVAKDRVVIRQGRIQLKASSGRQSFPSGKEPV